MSKYDIKKNQALPSDEEINKHKNFDKVMKKAALYEYKQATKPIYKNVKVLSAVAVIVAIGLIILFETTEREEVAEQKTEQIHTENVVQIIPQSDTAKPVIPRHTPTNEQTEHIPQNQTTSTESTNTTTHSTTDENNLIEVNEATIANFPGGDEALHAFLLKNIKYPYNAIESPYSGKIEVELVIEKKGEVGSFIIYHNPNSAISNEIKRVIKLMPKWQAATKNNQPVVSKVTVYFPFTYSVE